MSKTRNKPILIQDVKTLTALSLIEVSRESTFNEESILHETNNFPSNCDKIYCRNVAKFPAKIEKIYPKNFLPK